jgi:hypothetical protein
VSLERIVRPFATVDVTPPVRVLDPTAAPIPNIVLELGKVGTVKTLNGSFNSSIDAYTDDAHKEIKRTTETKTITNKDDPSQSVDVELIKKLTTEKGSQDTYKKSTFEFNNH